MHVIQLGFQLLCGSHLHRIQANREWGFRMDAYGTFHVMPFNHFLPSFLMGVRTPCHMCSFGFPLLRRRAPQRSLFNFQQQLLISGSIPNILNFSFFLLFSQLMSDKHNITVLTRQNHASKKNHNRKAQMCSSKAFYVFKGKSDDYFSIYFEKCFFFLLTKALLVFGTSNCAEL